MEKKELYFKLEKETKNKRRYTEISNGDPIILQTIYIPKWFAGTSNKIKITIEDCEE